MNQATTNNLYNKIEEFIENYAIQAGMLRKIRLCLTDYIDADEHSGSISFYTKSRIISKIKNDLLGAAFVAEGYRITFTGLTTQPAGQYRDVTLHFYISSARGSPPDEG